MSPDVSADLVKIVQGCSPSAADVDGSVFDFDGRRSAFSLAFVSPHMDFAGVARALSQSAAGTPLVAVSTAGELCEIPGASGDLYLTAAEQRQSYVVQSFSPDLIERVSIHAIPLHNDDIRSNGPPLSRSERVDRIAASLRAISLPFPIDCRDTIALTFIDGLSACESYLMEAVYQSGQFPCLFIGGSAGGTLDFRATFIYDGARVLENHAVVVFLKLAKGKRFSVLKSQNFCRSDKSFVVLKADPDHRLVSTVVDPDSLEIFPVPAAMAHVLGCDVADLSAHLENRTFGIDVDGEIYIRAVFGIDAERGTASFYCDVNAGDRLYLLEKIDFVEKTRRDYQVFLKGKPRPIAGILNDCMLRRLNNGDALQGLNGMWGCKVAGFSTFGELFGININQTLSAIFFFDAPDGVAFSDPFIDAFPVHYGRFSNYFTACKLRRIELLNRLRTRTSHLLVDQFAEMDNGSEEIDSLAIQARMEKALRASQKRLEAITSSLFDGVLLIDGKGLITFINPAARAILGGDDLAAPHLDDLVKLVVEGESESFSAVVVAKAITHHETFSDDDAVFELANGQRISVSYAIAPTREDQELEGGVVSFRNIDALRKAEQEALRASRLASVGQLAAGIAHEINTPIQYVGDNLRFILRSLADVSALIDLVRQLMADQRLSAEDEQSLREAFIRFDLDYLLTELSDAASQSLEGTDHVAHIVRSMKEFSHPGTTTKTMADINHAIESTVTISSNEWKHVATMELDLDPDLPRVECFAADINQVFLNLIVNAAHAIGGAPAKGFELGVITVSTRRQEDGVEIRICDTGPGIPADIRRKIFDPFFTTKAMGKGTGQGLSICLNTIENKHGGRLYLDEGGTSGTVFVVILPVGGRAEKTKDGSLDGGGGG